MRIGDEHPLRIHYESITRLAHLHISENLIHFFQGDIDAGHSLELTIDHDGTDRGDDVLICATLVIVGWTPDKSTLAFGQCIPGIVTVVFVDRFIGIVAG